MHNLPQTLTVYQERLQRRSIVHLRDDWIRTVVRIGTKRFPPRPIHALTRPHDLTGAHALDRAHPLIRAPP